MGEKLDYRLDLWHTGCFVGVHQYPGSKMTSTKLYLTDLPSRNADAPIPRST